MCSSGNARSHSRCFDYVQSKKSTTTHLSLFHNDCRLWICLFDKSVEFKLKNKMIDFCLYLSSYLLVMVFIFITCTWSTWCFNLWNVLQFNDRFIECFNSSFNSCINRSCPNCCLSEPLFNVCNTYQSINQDYDHSCFCRYHYDSVSFFILFLVQSSSLWILFVRTTLARTSLAIDSFDSFSVSSLFNHVYLFDDCFSKSFLSSSINNKWNNWFETYAYGITSSCHLFDLLYDYCSPIKYFTIISFLFSRWNSTQSKFDVKLFEIFSLENVDAVLYAFDGD